jgi:hypothetical protein
VPGWTLLPATENVSIELDASQPMSGKSCVYLDGRQGAVRLQSADFITPPTGQLVLSVYARGAHMQQNSQLRIFLETTGESPYRTHTVVNQAPEKWKNFTFPVYDLPLDSRAKMHIRFELHGGGEIWLDNVKLHDLAFNANPQETGQLYELVKTREAARIALDDGKFVDCLSLLDGYWPRFLEAYTPSLAPIEHAPPHADQLATPPPDAEKTPRNASFSERLKGFFFR